MKRIGKIPEGSFLEVGLYPSIPHKEGILALKGKLEEQTSSKNPTNDLVQLAEFVLKNNFFELNNEIKVGLPPSKKFFFLLASMITLQR